MIWWVVRSFTFPPTPFLRPNQETFSLPSWVLVFIQIHWIALNHIKGQQFTRAKVRIGMPEKCWRNLEEMLETCRRRILGTLWLVALCEIPTRATQQQKETFSLKPIPISNVVTIRRHFLIYSCLFLGRNPPIIYFSVNFALINTPMVGYAPKRARNF